MDRMNPQPNFTPSDTHYSNRFAAGGRIRKRRDTISVAKSQMQASAEEIKRWHGAPPRPMPETDRDFRPKELLF